MENGQELKRLCELMNDENHIFRQLLKMEKLKNGLIITQKVEELKKVSEEEEKYLDEVYIKEKERETIIDKLFNKYKLNSEKVLTVLLKALPSEENNVKQELKRQKSELIRNIKDLKKINTVNNKLLMDSIKFFNYINSSVQSIESISYANVNGRSVFNKAQIINRQV